MIQTLIIKDKIITEKNISSNEFMSYIGLLMLLKKDEKIYYANVKQIAYLLTGKYPSSCNLDKNVLSGIKGLISREIIIKVSSNVDGEWILDLHKLINVAVTKENIKEHKEYYTVLDRKDICKILLLNEAYYIRSITLLRFYAYVLSTIYKNGNNKGVGFTSLEVMSNDTGHSTKTVSSYLKSLVELELLYIYKSKDFIKFDTGEFIEISHTYGRFQDKDKIIQIGVDHEKEYGEKIKNKHKKIKKTSSDKNRSYAQKFKHLEKCIKDTGEIPYKTEECKKIYQVMKRLNEQYKNIKEQKDLSIFDNFNFYED